MKHKHTIKGKQLQAPVITQAPQAIGKKGKQVPLTINSEQKTEVDYFRFYESLYRKEVKDWQDARISRRDPFHMYTYPMQQLYRDSMLDNHLSGAIDNRILRVTNKQFVFKDKTGAVIDELSAKIQTRWFKQLIRACIESKFYGYSGKLLQIENGVIVDAIEIPRENIIPERGVILKNNMDISSEAIQYNAFPNHIIVPILGNDAIGILERIAPLTIFKRHSWASWDEFEQLFGVPIRIARTMIDTKKHKDDLQNWLETMGQSAYAIFDKRVDIEVKENNRSDASKVFADKIALINKEISKGILGQTMTMDDGSSQSQAEVHLQTLDEITSADISDIEYWINDKFIQVLLNWGYNIPEGAYIEALSNISLKPSEKIKIDQVLMQGGYKLTKEYIENTYNVQIDEAATEASKQQTQQGSQLGFFV